MDERTEYKLVRFDGVYYQNETIEKTLNALSVDGWGVVSHSMAYDRDGELSVSVLLVRFVRKSVKSD